MILDKAQHSDKPNEAALVIATTKGSLIERRKLRRSAPFFEIGEWTRRLGGTSSVEINGRVGSSTNSTWMTFSDDFLLLSL